MNRFSFISELLRTKWLIESSYVHSNMKLIDSILSKEQFAASFDAEDKKSNYFPQILTATGELIQLNEENSNSEPGVAVISLTSPIMKADFCGDAGAVTLASYIKAAEQSDNVMGIVLRTDCPGGSVHASDLLSTAIKDCKKPTIAWIDHGMMASGAMWVGASCDKIYASSEMDYIGSIGVMTTISTYKSKDFEDVYADQSKSKNKISRELDKGNKKPLKKDLTAVCDKFISHVKENREIDVSAGNPFEGDMYEAKKAEQIGLIDGIITFDQVIMEINAMANAGPSFGI